MKIYHYSSPCNLPFSFARHHWFVIEKDGRLSRWEILFRNNSRKAGWGHLHLGAFKPFQGIEVLPFSTKYSWGSKLIESVVGDSQEIRDAAELIENSVITYPHMEKYGLLGPNSNTYAQWVLDNCHLFKKKLSWNSFGKGFKSDSL